MRTLYGHKSGMLSLSILNENNMVSVGMDKKPILWKLNRESQVMFDEQPFWSDCVQGVNPYFFLTGDIRGKLSLWNVGRRRPISEAQ